MQDEWTQEKLSTNTKQILAKIFQELDANQVQQAFDTHVSLVRQAGAEVSASHHCTSAPSLHLRSGRSIYRRNQTIHSRVAENLQLKFFDRFSSFDFYSVSLSLLLLRDFLLFTEKANCEQMKVFFFRLNHVEKIERQENRSSDVQQGSADHHSSGNNGGCNDREGE